MDFYFFPDYECINIRHESAIKEKTRKNSHSELHKRKALTDAAGGQGVAVRPPAGPGMSPGGGHGGKAPRKFRIFSSKNALDWLLLSQFLPLI